LNHTLLPNTAAAKQAEASFLLAQGFIANFMAMITPLTAGGQFLLIPGTIVTAIFLLQKARTDRRVILFFLPIVWALGHIILFAALLPAPYQHGRYVIPALAGFLVFSTGGLVNLVATRWRSVWGRVLTRSLALTAVGLFIWFWGNGAAVFGVDVRLIQSDMIKASVWVKTNIPSDQLMAVHDIGAVGYFAPHPMIDIAGLITPDIIPAIRQYAAGDRDAFKPYLRDHEAVYLMVLNNQWVDPDHDPDLCLLYNAGGGMGGMRVYRLDWNHTCPK
jgi:hypothetical protein